MKKITIIIGLLLIGFTGFSQKQQVYDVELKSGTILVGVLKMMTEDTVKVEIYGGSLFVLPRTDVLLIKKHEGRLDRKFKNKGDFKVKLSGNYFVFAGTNISGRNAAGWTSTGLGTEFIAGKQLNQKLGVGFGTGYHNFGVESGYQIIPLFAEARGYLLNEPTSPYYAVSAGYGFGLKSETQSIIKARGGFYLNPSIGIRFATRSNAAFIMDMGYTIQKAKYTTSLWRGGEQIDNLTFKRISVRIGVIF